MALGDHVYVDPDEFRALLDSRITRYHEAIERLENEKPAVDPEAFGQGFAESGVTIAAAVERVHKQTVERLRARVSHIEEMQRLVADVDAADHESAAGLRAVSRHV